MKNFIQSLEKFTGIHVISVLSMTSIGLVSRGKYNQKHIIHKAQVLRNKINIVRDPKRGNRMAHKNNFYSEYKC